jgi:Tat protein secretion system quality control protein TatD with DNase activity
LRDAIARTELEHLVLETDAPDQRVQHKRGPLALSDIVLIAQEVAALQEREVMSVRDITEVTTRDLYRL